MAYNTEFEKSVEYHKFKMVTLQTILKLVKPNVYMATIDIQDAYYSVPFAVEHRKLLKFLGYQVHLDS